MKKYLIFLMALMLGLTVQAQLRPIYFNGDNATLDPTNATSYGVFGKLSTENLWVLKRYDLKDNLMQTGSYKDPELTIPHGQFVFYMDVDYFNLISKENFKLKGKTRFTYQQGAFSDGVEQGRWVLFYPDGNIFNLQDYKDGKLNGEFKTFDKYGKIILSGQYVMDKKEGEWIVERGKRKEVYKDDVLVSSEVIKTVKGNVKN